MVAVIVLNLIITGIPSIPKDMILDKINNAVLNLIITGIPSIQKKQTIQQGSCVMF